MPFRTKTLSTYKKGVGGLCFFDEERSFVISALSSSIPLPVREDTATAGSFLPIIFSHWALASSMRSSSMSFSARSDFVITRRMESIFIAFSTRKWSEDICIQPSSAATIKRAASKPHVPATILRIKRSWPGTSTMPTVP